MTPDSVVLGVLTMQLTECKLHRLVMHAHMRHLRCCHGILVNHLYYQYRRPKDFKAGLASGAKSVGKGFLAGTVGLFAAPAVGAIQGGPLGFGKGLAAGGHLCSSYPLLWQHRQHPPFGRLALCYLLLVTYLMSSKIP